MNGAVKTIMLVAICVAAFAATATATPPVPPQPSSSTLPGSGSIALSWSEPTQCSDWYVNPDASRWEFWHLGQLGGRLLGGGLLLERGRPVGPAVPVLRWLGLVALVLLLCFAGGRDV